MRRNQRLLLIVNDVMETNNIAAAVAEERAQLARHRLYTLMNSRQNIIRFMEYHVWAVWDFMSLLKSLQQHLTCVQIPWIPVGDAEVRFLINEIVVGEESDVNRHNVRTSHFEMYLEAMRGMGASTSSIERFVDDLRNGANVSKLLQSAAIPKAACRFVQFTMDVVGRGKPHEIASVFTFGREEIIPTMFLGILDTLENKDGGSYEDLRYYLERHIEVDGGHHGPLAERMVELLCATDATRYQEAATIAKQALQHRIALWDAVADECLIHSGSQTSPTHQDQSATILMEEQ